MKCVKDFWDTRYLLFFTFVLWAWLVIFAANVYSYLTLSFRPAIAIFSQFRGLSCGTYCFSISWMLNIITVMINIMWCRTSHSRQACLAFIIFVVVIACFEWYLPFYTCISNCCVFLTLLFFIIPQESLPFKRRENRLWNDSET